MASRATLQYPGLSDVIGWDFTYTVGIRPSVCVVRIAATPDAPQAAPTGLLRMIQQIAGEQSRVFRFPDCAIERIGFDRDIVNGIMWIYAIRDRRWKWQFSEISGHYNFRVGGILEAAQRKSVRELATLLLHALGEDVMDVSVLPGNLYPEVKWASSNAARELSRLVSDYGCVPLIDPADNTAKVHRIGEPVVNLPSNHLRSFALPVERGAKPTHVKIVGGANIYQSSFDLEAVGLDTDGQIKPIDDLSYKPARGWSREYEDEFENVKGIYTDSDGILKDRRALAKLCIYRWYRLTGQTGQAGALQWSPDALIEDIANRPSRREDILPLRNTLIDTQADEDGNLRERRPRAYGLFWLKDFDQRFNAAAAQERDWPYGLALDVARGIVKFSEPCFIATSTSVDGTTRVPASRKPAAMKVVVSYSVQKNRQPLQYEKYESITESPLEFLTDVLHRPELVVRYNGATNNLAEVEALAEIEISVAKARHEDRNAVIAEYGNLIQIGVSGYVRQVSWRSGNGRPTTTTVSGNTQHNPYVATIEAQAEQLREQSLSAPQPLDWPIDQYGGLIVTA
jgi:hypothetical protein